MLRWVRGCVEGSHNWEKREAADNRRELLVDCFRTAGTTSLSIQCNRVLRSPRAFEPAFSPYLSSQFPRFLFLRCRYERAFEPEVCGPLFQMLAGDRLGAEGARTAAEAFAASHRPRASQVGPL